MLMGVAPIRFITVGGMLSVSLFGNRSTTKDIDFLLDPSVDVVQEYRGEVLRMIRLVGETLAFNEDWMNDELRIFVRRAGRLSLFLRSVEQGLVAHRGRNLVVYAARLDFALERKLRRLGEDLGRARDPDLSDAVALVHRLRAGGHPLSWAYVRALDDNEFGLLVGDRGIDATAREYINVYGSQGIVETEWDQEAKRYRYKSLEGEWVHM